MTDDEALTALREAFAGADDASAAWSQTAPDVKAKCVAFVAAARSDEDRRSRASEVARLAASGPIHDVGAGLPGVPDFLRHGVGGQLQPPGA